MNNERYVSPVIIDTDPAMGFSYADVDDNIAILFALRGGLKIGLITIVSGNVKAREAYCSLLATLSMSEFRDSSIPIAVGGESALSGAMITGRDLVIHCLQARTKRHLKHFSDKRLELRMMPTNEHLPAPIAIINYLKNTQHKSIKIIALGPLTNLALAYLMNKKVFTNVEQIIFMGGKFENKMPVQEFNVQTDPEAAAIILTGEIPVVVIPLDVTLSVPFTLEELQRIFRKNKLLNKFIIKWCKHWYAVCQKAFGYKHIFLHDVVATGFALKPELYQLERASIIVEKCGTFTRGQTLLVPIAETEKQLFLCTKVNIDEFKSYFLEIMSN